MNAIQAIAQLDTLDNQIHAVEMAIGFMELRDELKKQAFHLTEVRNGLEDKKNQLRNKLNDLEVE